MASSSWFWHGKVCAIKIIFVITIQGVYVIIMDIKQNEKPTFTYQKMTNRKCRHHQLAIQQFLEADNCYIDNEICNILVISYGWIANNTDKKAINRQEAEEENIQEITKKWGKQDKRQASPEDNMSGSYADLIDSLRKYLFRYSIRQCETNGEDLTKTRVAKVCKPKKMKHGSYKKSST